MNLIVLGDAKPLAGGSYRGVSRNWPTYFNELPEDHELNQLFLWSINDSDKVPVVHDLGRAVRFAQLCTAQGSQGRFEVIEVVVDGEGSETQGSFLGFDLVEGHTNSILQWGLKGSVAGAAMLPAPIRVLSHLLSKHFAPQLNENGLFSERETASFCLESMVALQSFSPCLYEGGDLGRFRLPAVYLVA